MDPIQDTIMRFDVHEPNSLRRLLVILESLNKKIEETKALANKAYLLAKETLK
jgi:hypothetical protein